jgi:hypothetical protein
MRLNHTEVTELSKHTKESKMLLIVHGSKAQVQTDEAVN